MSDAEEWAQRGVAELLADFRGGAEDFPVTQAEAAALMRAAYARGYVDTLTVPWLTGRARRQVEEWARELRLRIPVC